MVHASNGGYIGPAFRDISGSLMPNTVLALRCEGVAGSTTFADLSTVPHIVTAQGGAAVSSAQSKWGGGSLYLDGSGDALSLTGGASTVFGTADFTVRLWIRPDADISGNARLCGNRSGVGGGWTLFLRDGAKLAFHTDTASPIDNAGSIVPLAWSLVEIGRSAGIMYGFVNGVVVGSNAFVENFSSTVKPMIGADPGGATPFKGCIQDVQMVVGDCLNSAAYALPGRMAAPVGGVWSIAAAKALRLG